MISIEYAIAEPSPHVRNQLASATDTDIHYNYFLGDIYLKFDDIDLSANWGWIPVFDFAVCLQEIVNALPNTKAEQFEFTESGDTISFSYLDGQVMISTSYVEVIAEVGHAELRDAFLNFRDRLLTDLFTAYPEFKLNKYAQSLVREV